MTRRQIIYLSFAVLYSAMFSVVAAEDEEVAPEMEVMESGATDTRMIRTTSPVDGYQPLTVAGQEVAAAYLEETLGERHGAIILFHDQGEQFESKGVVTPLRHQLLQYGWSTLTLQFNYSYEPNILLSTSEEGVAVKAEEGVDEVAALVAAALSEDDESPEPAETPKDISEDISEDLETEEGLPPVSNQQRLDAAIAFLQAKDIQRIVFLGHGDGGEMAIRLSEKVAISLSALILAGTPMLPTDQVFETLRLPILDIYGDLESLATVNAIKHRKIVMKRNGNDQYVMREVLGANHEFYGLQTQLTLTIRDWLKKTFVEQETQ